MSRLAKLLPIALRISRALEVRSRCRSQHMTYSVMAGTLWQGVTSYFFLAHYLFLYESKLFDDGKSPFGYNEGVERLRLCPSKKVQARHSGQDHARGPSPQHRVGMNSCLPLKPVSFCTSFNAALIVVGRIFFQRLQIVAEYCQDGRHRFFGEHSLCFLVIVASSSW